MFQVNFVDVKAENAIFDGEGWDAVVVVTPDLDSIGFDEIGLLAQHGAHVDKRVGKSPTLLFAPGLAGGRLIIAPVTQVNDEYVDVRVEEKVFYK